MRLCVLCTVCTDHKFHYCYYCYCRWFTTLVNQPQFQAVVGKVDLAKEELLAAGAPAPAKKEKKVRSPFRAYSQILVVDDY
jgi:hypothetical protein